MTPGEIIEKIKIEISFYIDQINDNIKYVSPYVRYVNANKEFIENNPDDEEEFFREAYNNYHSYFPYLINNSLLVAFDSYIEYKLQLIFCEFRVKKRKKSTNESFINYYSDNILEKFSINLSNVEKDWIIIMDLHSIRNKIVHLNSSLSKSFQPSHIEIIKAKKDGVHNLLMKYKEYINYNEITTRFYIDDDKLLTQYLITIENYLIHILRQIQTAAPQ